MIDTLRRFIAEQTGATAIEYTLIAILTGVIAIGGLSLFGATVTDKFFMVRDSVEAASAGP